MEGAVLAGADSREFAASICVPLVIEHGLFIRLHRFCILPAFKQHYITDSGLIYSASF